MTSRRRSSWRLRLTLRSRRGTLVATVAPASRQTLAAANAGCPSAQKSNMWAGKYVHICTQINGHAGLEGAWSWIRNCIAGNQNPLVDLRFADDILMFAASVEQSLDMLRSLVDALRNAGSILNVSKTKLSTTQAQPPDHVWLDVQTKIDGLRTSQKWLGCCLCLPEDQDADVEPHLSAAARAFWANKWILCDKHVPIELRIKYFEAVVTPVACFGAGHRKMYQHQLHKFDVEWRRLLRTLLSPPPGLDWNLPWRQILHSWNRRISLAKLV